MKDAEKFILKLLKKDYSYGMSSEEINEIITKDISEF